MRMQTTFRLLTCLFFIALATSIAHAQTPAITYQRYDTDITIQHDGIFRVREIQQIRFDGEFHTAFAEIPTNLTTDIRNVQLYEGESPYSQGGTGANTFSSEPSGNAVYVSWEYAPTQPGDVRTFVLEYEVVGGLWVYPDETVLEWRAVPADRSGIVVENSVVTVTLPSAVTSDQLHYTAYGPTYQTATQPTALVFAASEPLPDGVQFQVQVGFPPGAVTAQRQPWQVQEDSARLDYRFQALNVDLVLQSDGALLVDEAHHLAVDAGLLDQGFRQLPLHFLDAIDQIQLMEGEQAFTEETSGCDYCLQVKQTARQPDWVRYDDDQRKVVTRDSQAGSVELNWQFPPLVRGEETTLHLRYRALGAVRHFADHQEIRWSAVFPEHKQTVESATVRLKLPETVARNQVKISGGTVQWQPDGSALLVATSGFPPNRAWEIVVSLPVSATTGAIPQWQQMLENAANEAQQAEIGRARLKLGFGVAALLIFLLGLLGVYLLWFLRGRDQAQPAVATYLTEPPSTLSPAIVAYLLDEVASANGALASLFHLATLGLLRIRFDGIFVLKRMEEVSPVAGESIQTSSGEETILPNHLVTLFTALQPLLPLQKEVPLHQIYNQFQAALPKVYREMGEETTRFFDELPPQARHRWLERGQWLVLLSVGVALVLGWLYYGDMGWLAIAPALAASVAGIALMVASRWMPRRTAVGVEEKQRWLAFRNYTNERE